MQNLKAIVLSEEEKLKHELLGSLGIIKMLSTHLIDGNLGNPNSIKFCHMIKNLAERNMSIIVEAGRIIDSTPDI